MTELKLITNVFLSFFKKLDNLKKQ